VAGCSQPTSGPAADVFPRTHRRHWRPNREAIQKDAVDLRPYQSDQLPPITTVSAVPWPASGATGPTLTLDGRSPRPPRPDLLIESIGRAESVGGIAVYAGIISKTSPRALQCP